MGRRRNSKDELLKLRSRLVLAAFVFNPQGAGPKPGFQGRDIADTADRVFKRYFLGYSNARTGLLRITTTCKSLVRLGYLQQGPHVASSFLMPSRAGGTVSRINYMSPTFILTESGLMKVLSECDPRFLVRLRPAAKMMRRSTYKSRICGYDLENHNSAEMFLRFVGLSEEEYAKGIHIDHKDNEHEKTSSGDNSYQTP